MKGFLVRSIFFLDRHRLWTYAFVGAGIFAAFYRYGAGTSMEAAYLCGTAGVTFGLIGIMLCKIMLDEMTKRIVRPRMDAAYERERPKKAKAWQEGGEGTYESAEFSKDNEYSRARLPHLNEDSAIDNALVEQKIQDVIRRRRRNS